MANALGKKAGVLYSSFKVRSPSVRRLEKKRKMETVHSTDKPLDAAVEDVYQASFRERRKLKVPRE